VKLSPGQIDILAAEVVRRLEGRGMVRLADRAAIVERIGRALLEDLQVEDRLNEEVRGILEGLADQMERQNVQYHEMFKLVKAKLVRERRLIL
jgi:hypothetical protein